MATTLEVESPNEYRQFKRPFRTVWRVGGGRASASLGADRMFVGGISASRARGAQRPWPFPADFRQRAERFPAGSWPLRVAFLVSPSALRLCSGQASWPAGCHAATAGGARGAGR